MPSMTMPAPRFQVREVRFYERDVRLRLPFRFGVVTLTAAPQLFVRARILAGDGREAWGRAAELLAPKWFDKNLALSNEENFEQLRRAARRIAGAYVEDTESRSAFGRFTTHYRTHLTACQGDGLNALVASFGPALIDRALLDALCLMHGVSFYDAIRSNLPGMVHSADTPDLNDFDLDRFLRALTPATHLSARHTVGLVDPITAADLTTPLNDGLPETLEQVVATYGHRFFKLKVGGEMQADLDRLQRIASVIDRIDAPYFVTLDGNEQYQSNEGIVDLWRRAASMPSLARLVSSTLFIEQPLARSVALERSVAELAAFKPVLVDESDADLDAFPRARSLGYAGVSSKACKGFYKSIINAARCANWNATDTSATRCFMSGEDLTCQAGLAVQQDLAIVALLGLGHVERNGHHYVNGMAGLPDAEQNRFLSAHPDLYHRHAGAVRLRIDAGRLALGSLAAPGFGSAADPDWTSMRPIGSVN